MDQSDIKIRPHFAKKIVASVKKDWRLYVLLMPMVIWYLVWMYKPMGGLLMAFKRYDPTLGLINSDFKGIVTFLI